MEGIKYVNLIEIGPLVLEIQGTQNGELAVPVNNTLVSHTAFLAADTQPCVLIFGKTTMIKTISSTFYFITVILFLNCGSPAYFF